MNPEEEDIVTDDYGTQWLVTSTGRRMVPPKGHLISKPGEFTEYDSSRGHCPLCGSLSCNGNCFK